MAETLMTLPIVEEALKCLDNNCNQGLTNLFYRNSTNQKLHLKSII